MKFKCYKCGNEFVEMLEEKQYACKNCRTLYQLSPISSEEMIEWFCN